MKVRLLGRDGKSYVANIKGADDAGIILKREGTVMRAFRFRGDIVFKSMPTFVETNCLVMDSSKS